MKTAALALTAALLVAGLPAVGLLAAPGEPGPTAQAEAQRVDLAHATWTRNGEELELRPWVVEAGLRPPGAVLAPGEVPPAPHVVLSFEGMGERWAHVFTTPEAAMMRLELEWRPGPDGALFEVILNGQRLLPARDGWRPTERTLRTDLGAIWMGRGEHLLEFVSREASDTAMLRLSALRLTRRGGD